MYTRVPLGRYILASPPMTSEESIKICFPFLGKTFMDHWEENKDLLKEPMWVKFVYLSGALSKLLQISLHP